MQFVHQFQSIGLSSKSGHNLFVPQKRTRSPHSSRLQCPYSCSELRAEWYACGFETLSITRVTLVALDTTLGGVKGDSIVNSAHDLQITNS